MSKYEPSKGTPSEKKVTFKKDVDSISGSDLNRRDIKFIKLPVCKSVSDNGTKSLNSTVTCLFDKFKSKNESVEHLCPPLSNKRVNIRFSYPPTTFGIHFDKFDALLDLWFVYLRDEENIFHRQFEETEYRARIVMENESLVTQLHHWTGEVRKMQGHLETNLSLLDLHFKELEKIVNTTSNLESECFNPRGHYIYNCLVNIDCRIKDIENDLSEINSYLNDIESKFPNSPFSMIKKILRLNENTILQSINNVCNLESAALCVHKQMNLFETLHKSATDIRHC